MTICESVFESRELLEIIDDLIGINKPRGIYSTDKEDMVLFNRVERKVKAKLAKKGIYHATQSHHR